MDPINTISQPTFFQMMFVPWAIRIATAIALWIVGKWIAKKLVRLSRRLMAKAQLDEMLIKFAGNIIYTVLLIVVGIAALDQLGIKTTSLLAVFGAAGLAVGLALKDSLANFSSGVLLILFRPFKVGDFIEAAGVLGTVDEVRIFSTILHTPDNRQVIVPNGQIYGGTIVNFSANSTRRIDLVIGIGYEDDLRKARDIIETIVKNDDRILEEPEPYVALGELADSSINIDLRPWVNRSDYLAVKSSLLENIKTSFDENGISIPYPQQDVHLHKVSA
ncbi:MAG: mechanosensitive ion channel [Gammaproteobacteria bacterium]|nr:mechanosensitive ion channel [Gammaproteobacteria bacterium]